MHSVRREKEGGRQKKGKDWDDLSGQVHPESIERRADIEYRISRRLREARLGADRSLFSQRPTKRLRPTRAAPKGIDLMRSQ